MNTLLLDTVTWDLVLDAAGNIAVAAEPYSLAQDAASAIRLFAGELYYNTARGIPYLSDVFGVFPPPYEFLRAQMVQAALTVPDVASAQVFFIALVGRTLTAQVQIRAKSGQTAIFVLGPDTFGVPAAPVVPPLAMNYTRPLNASGLPILWGI